MTTRPIIFGPPYPTLHRSQVSEAMGGEYINLFRDLDGSLRKRSGLSLAKDFNQAGKPILGLHDDVYTGLYTVRQGTTNGVLIRTDDSLVDTTVTGTTLLNNYRPYWAHDGTSLFAANGGRINKINTGAFTATLLASGNAPDNVAHIGFAKGNLIAGGLISGGVSGDVNFSIDKAHGYVAADSWDFFNNEHSRDGLVNLAIEHDEIVAFGTESVEISYHDGVTPWAALQGALLQYGVGTIQRVFTPAVLSDTIYAVLFLDGAFRVVRVKNRVPEVLSTPYDTVLNSDANRFFLIIADYLPKGFGVTFEGNPFYVLALPQDTLVYAPRHNEWYRWSTWTGTAHDAWVINAHTFSSEVRAHLIGDRTDAKIWKLDGSVTDGGTAIRAEATTGKVRRGTDRRKQCQRLRFLLKRGQASDNSEPKITVQFRDDGAERWGAPHGVSLGFRGQSEFYGSLSGCGSYRSREYRVVHEDSKSDFILTSVEEDFDVLES